MPGWRHFWISHLQNAGQKFPRIKHQDTETKAQSAFSGVLTPQLQYREAGWKSPLPWNPLSSVLIKPRTVTSVQ